MKKNFLPGIIRIQHLNTFFHCNVYLFHVLVPLLIPVLVFIASTIKRRELGIAQMVDINVLAVPKMRNHHRRYSYEHGRLSSVLQ